MGPITRPMAPANPAAATRPKPSQTVSPRCRWGSVGTATERRHKDKYQTIGVDGCRAESLFSGLPLGYPVAGIRSRGVESCQDVRSQYLAQRTACPSVGRVHLSEHADVGSRARQS